MPALSVSIDGKMIATVCTDGYNVLSVSASGTRIDDELAHLDVAGGTYPEDGDSTYLMWASALPLQLGQVVTVAFLESALSSHAGKTIEELFPEELSSETKVKPIATVIDEIRAKTKLRDNFSFRLKSSLGTMFVGETTPDEHGFGFTVLWNSFHPERARVSLHSYTLESLEARGPMTNHVEERISHGASVCFELVG